MLKGAYSEKHRSAQTEHIERLKEQAKFEGLYVKDRVKELSKETNRRRRALENRKKQLEKEEERKREEVLAERHKEKEEATQKFQKDFHNKKNNRPNSGKEPTQGTSQLQDGIRVVRGPGVEINDQLTRVVPTLEDALNLVNNQYKHLGDHTIQYYGPKEMYHDFNTDYTHIGNFRAQTMSQGPGGNMGPVGMQSYGANSLVTNSNHGNYEYGVDLDEQVRLREEALQNGGLNYAFMDGETTEGALPPTMARDSPDGSLTSLDSLDEVPSDNLVTKEFPTQKPGVVLKDSKVKSAGRRRVTFSDSIEFDDGLTGLLVTAEKASCKEYVKLYNSRLAASNAAYSMSLSNASRQSASKAANTNSLPEKAVQMTPGTPGCTPMKRNELPSSGYSTAGASTSMVVPMSVYSQIEFTGNKVTATTGEATSSSPTQSEHPGQGIAGAASRRPRGNEAAVGVSADELKAHEVVQALNVKDSLDVLRDSLEHVENGTHQQQERFEPGEYLVTKVTRKELNQLERISNECPGQLQAEIPPDSNDEPAVDYYGNPSTIYRNPFGQRITSEEASRIYYSTVANVSTVNGLNPGTAHDFPTDSAGQNEGSTQDNLTENHVQLMRNEGNAYEDLKNFSLSNSEHKTTANNPANNFSYYRSWYPGSFFPSKVQAGGEGAAARSERAARSGSATDCGQTAVHKDNSVAFDIMNDYQCGNKYPGNTRIADNPQEIGYPTVDSGADMNGAQKSLYNMVGPENTGVAYHGHNPSMLGGYTSGYNTIDGPESAQNQSKGPRKNFPTSTHKTLHGGNQVGKNTSSPSAMIAKPPHPSTRHKGVVYSSPLHRKRAVAAVARRGTTGKTSPRGTARKTHKSVTKKNEDFTKTNEAKNQVNSNQNSSQFSQGKARGYSSGSDDDEVMQNIRRDMERINIQNCSSPAQQQHQKMMNSINLSPQINSPLQTEPNIVEDFSPKSDFETVYKKVHQPRIGSSKQRGQNKALNKGSPSKIPTYVGPSGNGGGQDVPGSTLRNDGTKVIQGVRDDDDTNQPLTTPVRWADEQNMSTWTDPNMPHPQTTVSKRSIALDKTPTDDEINVLWDRVRNCLSHNEAQSVGSDSCVNRIDVRRSRARGAPYVSQGYQDYYPRRDSDASHNMNSAPIRTSSTGGMGTVGGLRRYGSHEVLRRYGSADSLGYPRQQPLLQQRAQRIRQSSQGKPPVPPRQPMNFSPMTSRQAPLVSRSNRAGPIPLTQAELRAVLQASQQTQERLHRTKPEQTPEQTQPYQHMVVGRKAAPSALSMEENRLLQSLDRLNERLKVQEVITANLISGHVVSGGRTNQGAPSPHSRAPSKHKRPGK